MSYSVIDDHFGNAGKSKTTRFYGTKFIEQKAKKSKFDVATVAVHGSLLNRHEYFREEYGPYLCTLLIISAFTFISGAALSLAGYYVPELSLKQLLSSNLTENEAVAKLEVYTNTLQGLRISGIVLLSIGGLSMMALILTPYICLKRDEYTPVHTDKDFSLPLVPTLLSPTKSTSSEPMLTYSILEQRVQPHSQSKSQKRMNQRRSPSYERGFLSPELNRGPIFVSDESHSINEHRRTRSSSCGTRLSPDIHRLHRKSSCNISDLMYAERKGALVKAGSFHSLR